MHSLGCFQAHCFSLLSPRCNVVQVTSTSELMYTFCAGVEIAMHQRQPAKALCIHLIKGFQMGLGSSRWFSRLCTWSIPLCSLLHQRSCALQQQCVQAVSAAETENIATCMLLWVASEDWQGMASFS